MTERVFTDREILAMWRAYKLIASVEVGDHQCKDHNAGRE